MERPPRTGCGGPVTGDSPSAPHDFAKFFDHRSTVAAWSPTGSHPSPTFSTAPRGGRKPRARGNAWSSSSPGSPSVVLPLLICSRCPVRRDCLREA
jgi:hypothetical protein